MFDFSKTKIIITVALLPIFLEEFWVLELIRILVEYVLSAKFDLNTDGVDMEMLESGKKKLRIQKYPYTCGRGLRRVSIGLITMMLL